MLPQLFQCTLVAHLGRTQPHIHDVGYLLKLQLRHEAQYQDLAIHLVDMHEPMVKTLAVYGWALRFLGFFLSVQTERIV